MLNENRWTAILVLQHAHFFCTWDMGMVIGFHSRFTQGTFLAEVY